MPRPRSTSRSPQADLAVATSEAKRLEAWVGYLTLTAPYDGVIVTRNANTFDFVLPSTGDPSADARVPHLSPSGSAAPIYVVDRTDIVRVFVDIPEQDANYVHGCDLRLMLSAKDVSQIPTAGRDLIIVAGVGNLLHFRIFDSDGKRVVNTDEKQLAKSGSQMTKLKSLLSKLRKDPRVSPLDKDEVIKSLASMFGGTYVPNGTKASVLAQAYRDEPIAGTVTRTSWALNVKSRTLRAEIDLPNPGGQLLPGMYAYANVIIERTGVRALPVSALTSSGDRTYCWICQDGRAQRTEIQTGVSEGQWIEVTNLRRPTDRPAWTVPGGPSTVLNR